MNGLFQSAQNTQRSFILKLFFKKSKNTTLEVNFYLLSLNKNKEKFLRPSASGAFRFAIFFQPKYFFDKTLQKSIKTQIQQNHVCCVNAIDKSTRRLLTIHA